MDKVESDKNVDSSEESEIGASLPSTTSKSALVLDHHKILPSNLQSWRDAGTLSGVDGLVTLSCYDDDPAQVGDREDKHTTVLSDASEETLAVTATDDESAKDTKDSDDEEDATVMEMQAALRAHQERMMHMHPHLLEEMSTFYKIDLDEARKHDSVFMIKGMRRALKV